MAPFIAGNWKMHGMTPQLAEIEAIAASVKAEPPFAKVLICLPATLSRVRRRLPQAGSP